MTSADPFGGCAELRTLEEIDRAVDRGRALLGLAQAPPLKDIAGTPIELYPDRARAESALVEICRLLLRRGDAPSLRRALEISFVVHELERRARRWSHRRSSLFKGMGQIGLGHIELGIKNTLRAVCGSDARSLDPLDAMLADWALAAAALRARDLSLAGCFVDRWRQRAIELDLAYEITRADLCERLLAVLFGEGRGEKVSALRRKGDGLASPSAGAPLLLGLDWTGGREAEPGSFEEICALRGGHADGAALDGLETGELSHLADLFASWQLVAPLQDVERRIRARDPDAYYRSIIGRSLGRYAAGRIAAESHVSRGTNSAPNAVIWMTDVNGYSMLSERTASAKLFPTLSPLFRTMNEELEAEGGMILEFIGDSILVVFNAFEGQSTEPHRILAATARCLTRLHDLGAISEMAGLERIAIGVGVNRGEVAIGYLGGLERCHLSTLGHTVNVAARLESLTRKLPRNVAISETLFENRRPNPWAKPFDVNYSLRDLGVHDLKGIRKPPRVLGLAPLVRHFVDFVPMGFVATPEPGVVYLDVGNSCRPGIVDHHADLSQGRSACQVVNRRPDLVTEHLAARRAKGRRGDDAKTASGTYEFRLHREPDLDCAAAYYSACEHLEGEPRRGLLRDLSKYVGDIDQGVIPNPSRISDSLYGVFVAHAVRLREMLGVRCTDRDLLEAGLRAIDAAMFLSERRKTHGKTADFSRVFATEPTWFAEEREWLHGDRARYEADLARGHAYTARIGGVGEPVVGVWLDHPRSALFKHWVRTDPNAPSGRGYGFMTVDWSKPGRRRVVISVDPELNLHLRGLGAALEAAEKRKRERIGNPRPEEPRRFDTDNSDPWYFGWGHEYTIVDAPERGTVLTAKEVEKIHRGWVP